MEKKPTISVVVPAFNEEKYLPRCLLSLKRQTYPPLEIIVVDNNSQDKTAKVAQKFGAKVIFEKKQGIAHARDAGFNAARGEIIARTDADGFVPPFWLEKIAKDFQDSQIVGVTGPIAFYDLSPFLNFASKYLYLFCFYLFRLVSGHHQFNGQNLALRKSVWQKISPSSENFLLHEDVDLACHACRLGKILFDPSLLTFTSSRRFRQNIFEPTLGYALRGIYTLLYHHHPFSRGHCQKLS